MIPPYPMQLTLLGSALYRELCIGLLRALTAPWLDPGSLTRTLMRTNSRAIRARSGRSRARSRARAKRGVSGAAARRAGGEHGAG